MTTGIRRWRRESGGAGIRPFQSIREGARLQTRFHQPRKKRSAGNRKREADNRRWLMMAQGDGVSKKLQ